MKHEWIYCRVRLYDVIETLNYVSDNHDYYYCDFCTI